ncbi:MAG: UDP-N-acetylmuramoyl-L-alanine--D-glutamate ligase [bacterium]|nr:UDP-N-acetylmuramoyl-L-alanine--D-glutamate ligase [bacterium]
MLTVEDIKNWKSLPPDLSGKRASVLGLARSGITAAKLLHAQGCNVLVSDAAENSSILEAAAQLRQVGMEVEVGGHSDQVIECDFIVRSPGVPDENAILRTARQQGLTVVSEIEVASWFCPAPIVGVTGSNGKTTTVEWLGDVYRRTGQKVAVCGNVGVSFSGMVQNLSPEDTVVLEISSFQLEDIIRFSPRVAIITNFSPDHLDRHKTYDTYIRAKCRIFENQAKTDSLIFNRGDAEVTRRCAAAPSRFISFGLDRPFNPGCGLDQNSLVLCDGQFDRQLLSKEELSLPGRHNLENAMAVACAAADLGVPDQIIAASLRQFPGVAHRLQKIIEANEVLWINDSKATNIASGLVALESYTRPIILLAGGRDKGSDFAAVAGQVAAKTKRIILFGEAGALIEKAWGKSIEVQRSATLKGAVELAARLAEPGDVVLLSPMCASFDEFNNYEQRGSVFAELVKAIAGRT